jgi:hypothetical protein
MLKNRFEAESVYLRFFAASLVIVLAYIAPVRWLWPYLQGTMVDSFVQVIVPLQVVIIIGVTAVGCLFGHMGISNVHDHKDTQQRHRALTQALATTSLALLLATFYLNGVMVVQADGGSLWYELFLRHQSNFGLFVTVLMVGIFIVGAYRLGSDLRNRKEDAKFGASALGLRFGLMLTLTVVTVLLISDYM